MKQPNVVFVFSDQQRWDTCGINGNPEGLTPNFDSLAKTGTNFPKCFTPQPVCGPSRACLQTGMYATANGTWRNGIPLNKSVPSLASCFKEAGYRTGYIGKWHLGKTGENAVKEPDRGGYQDWLAADILEACSDAYDCVVYNENCNEVKLPGYRVDALTDAAIRYIDEHQENPFFLFLSFLEPHHQNHVDAYPAPRGYEELYNSPWMPADLKTLGGTAHRHIPGYYGMIKRLDESLGRITDAIHSLGLNEDTIVIYTSDHGCHFKTRNQEYKRTCHDASTRVPCAINGPGFESGGERQELFSLLDLPPTLLEAAGIPIPDHMQGKSFVERLQKRDSKWAESIFVQTSEHELGRSIRTQRWKFGVLAPDLDGGKVPSAKTYTESFLYDLKHDPYELDNLISCPAHRPVADYLASRLKEKINEVEGENPTISKAPALDEIRWYQRKVYECEIYE
ncbi:MAG: sulfatase-like hydrolase/transferase [Opitutales bacterium]|nr:sulfatase-like hydrolase/transferase [Opitutales bacterium]